MATELLSGVAELVTSAGAFIAAIVAARKASSAADSASTAVNEVTPNHGGSLKDIVTRIERFVRSQGHQIGEIKRDAAITHDQIGEGLDDLRHRVRRLEAKD